MRETTDNNLYVELVEHMLELNMNSFIRRNGRIEFDDLPPVSVGCKCGECHVVGDTARYVNESVFNQELREIYKYRFTVPIGQKGGPADFRVGACAEQQTGNLCMKRSNCSVRDLEFTKAYAPRTYLPKSWCENCHLVFDDYE